MANLKEFSTYKNKLAEKFCTTESLSNLLRLDDEEDMSAKDLMYNRVFPYAYVPDVTETGRAFVCFEVAVPYIKSDVIKQVELRVYVFCSKSIMRLPKGAGIRTDAMASAVDKF